MSTLSAVPRAESAPTAGSWRTRSVAHHSAAPWLAVIALTALALALRLLSIHQSLWGDEGFTWLVTGEDSFSGMIDAVRGQLEVTPPFFFILAWIFRRLGDQWWLIRVPSIVAGAALVPLTFMLGRRTIGTATGVLGAALVALSPFAIYYSVEARNYSVLSAVVVGAALSLLKATNSDSSRAWWALFAALTALALYTHYTSVFVLGALFVWAAAYHWGCMRWLLGSGVVAALLFVPWLPELRADTYAPGSVAIDVLQPLSVRSYVRGLAAWLVGLPEASLKVVPGLVALALLALVLGGAVLVTAGRIARAELRRPSPGFGLLLLVALAAPLGTLIVSLISKDIFLPRNLASSLPAVLLLVAAAAMAVPGRARPVALAALLLTYAIAAASTFKPVAARPDFRAVAEKLDRQAAENAIVGDLFSAYFSGPQTRYVQFHSASRRTYVYGVTDFLTPDGRIDVLAAGPTSTGMARRSGQQTIEQAAAEASAGQGRSDVYLVFPDLDIFAGTRKVTGYTLVEQTRFAGSVPLLLERFVADPGR